MTVWRLPRGAPPQLGQADEAGTARSTHLCTPYADLKPIRPGSISW